MPRWISVAAMVAASAFVAPVSTHYLAPKSAVSAASPVTEDRPAPSGPKGGKVVRVAGTVASLQAASLGAQTLLDGQRNATAQGRQDIADLICGYTHEAIEDTAETCKSGPIRNAEVMIATMPDPVHTRLALRFDREIDVMEDELQQLGWTYDRSWLPWDGTTHKAPDRWEARAFDSHVQNALESLPGVLLFRHKDGTDAAEMGGQTSPGDLLVVLLVGEEPTGGVNAEQFAQALGYWQQPETLLNVRPCIWNAEPDCPVPTNLTILGPSFSGSLQSLDTMLRKHFAHWPASPFSLRIASGTVSDGEALKSLALPYRQSNVSVSITSFYPAAVDLSRGLSRFLRARQPTLKIAQVREKESGFGSIQDPKDPCATAKKASSADGKACDPDLQIGNFHYPREISQLRRAYEQNGIIGFSDPAGAPRNQLQLSTAQDDGGSDSVTMFAGTVDAVALEADLEAMTHELAAEDYSVVLLSGTDVMDEIFIARYLSQHAPNITIVIQDTDQLFLHQGADASLNNVYVASSWPLLWQNGRWSAAPGAANGTDMRFASASNQGVATALHYLLCSAVATDACGAKTFREYRSPFAGLDPGDTATSSPPIWLSLVEHGNFLPLALIDLTSGAQEKSGRFNLPAIADYDKEQIKAVTATGIHAVTRLPVKVLATVIIGLLLWHGWACHSCRLDRSLAWTYALAEREHHRIRMVIKCSLSLIGGFALALLFVPAQPGMQLQSFAFQRYLVAGQILAVLISMLSLRKLVAFESPKRPQVWTATFGALSLILLWIADYHLWPLLAPAGNGNEHLFFLYRVADPLSGASPAMPLLLMTAAAALFLHGVFSRLAFFGHRIPKLPDGFDYVRCPSNRSLRKLTKLLADVGDRRPWLAAMGCVFVMALVLCISEHNQVLSLEKGPFDDLMTALLVVSGAVILQNLFIAGLAWQKLRRTMLLPLKQSPLRWGFNWIKDFSWRRIWRSSKTLSSSQVFDYLFRLLQASSRRPGSSTGPMYYQSICALYLAADKGASPHDFTQGVEVIQRTMKEEAQSRLQELLLEWQTDRGPLTGSKESDRGVHLLQGMGDLKGEDRISMLRRMGDEEFVALIYVGYISMVLIQIRQRIFTAAALYILLLWSLTNYPWMYRHTILLLLVAFFVVLSVVTVFIYSGMHRDDILSRTTETEPGKLDGGFLTRVLAVLGIPLLTLVASQFPEVSSFVFSWLEPSLSKLP